MRYCIHCGAELGDGHSYCMSCGAPAAVATRPPPPATTPTAPVVLPPAPAPIPPPGPASAPTADLVLSAPPTQDEAPPAPWLQRPTAAGGNRSMLLVVAVLLAGAAAGAYLLTRDHPLSASAAPLPSQSQTPPTPTPSTAKTTTSPLISTPAATPTLQPPLGPPQDVGRQAFVSVPGQAPDGKDAANRPVSYAAHNLIDGDPSTCWRIAGDASGSVLTFQLFTSSQITSLGLINGYDKVDPASGVDRYTQERRITHVTWIFPDGTQIPQSLTDGTHAVQTFALPTPKTSDVVYLRIDRTRHSRGAAFDYTAISTVDIEGQ